MESNLVHGTGENYLKNPIFRVLLYRQLSHCNHSIIFAALNQTDKQGDINKDT